MTFYAIGRETDFLLPPSVRKWLLKAHLACCVVDVFEGLDLSLLEQRRTWGVAATPVIRRRCCRA